LTHPPDIILIFDIVHSSSVTEGKNVKCTKQQQYTPAGPYLESGAAAPGTRIEAEANWEK